MNRKPFVIASLALLALIIGWFLLSYFLKATITIQLDEGENIVLYDLNTSPYKEVWGGKDAQNKTVKVSKGDYYVVGNVGDNYTKQYFSVGTAGNFSVDLSYESSDMRFLKSDGDPTVQINEDGENISRVDEKGRFYVNGELRLSGSMLGSPINKVALNTTTALLTNSYQETYLVLDNKSPIRLFSEQSTDEIAGAYKGEVNSNNILAVSSNVDSGRFCALSIEGKIFDIASDGSEINEVGEAQDSNTILCRSDIVISAKMNYASDGERAARSGLVTVFRIGEGTVETFSIDDLTDIIMLSEERIAYISSDKIFIRTVGQKKPEIIMSVSSKDSATILEGGSPNELYLVDESQVWLLSIDEKTSNRIAFSPNIKGASYGHFLPATNSLYLSVNRGASIGNYVLANNPDLLNEYDILDASLPKKTPDYTIDFAYTGNQLVVKIIILAPIGSSGSTSLYDKAKAEALAYLETMNIDTSIVSVQFQ